MFSFLLLLLLSACSGQWISAGGLTAARHGHTATSLNNGLIMVCGGFNTLLGGFGTGIVRSCELYNSISGISSQSAWMTPGCGDHSATLLDTNKVLLCGGFAGPLASCMLCSTSGNIASGIFCSGLYFILLRFLLGFSQQAI
jgi:hypothetical protein